MYLHPYRKKNQWFDPFQLPIATICIALGITCWFLACFLFQTMSVFQSLGPVFLSIMVHRMLTSKKAASKNKQAYSVMNSNWILTKDTTKKEIKHRIKLLRTCKFCPHCNECCLRGKKVLANHSMGERQAKFGKVPYPNCDKYKKTVAMTRVVVSKWLQTFRADRMIKTLTKELKKGKYKRQK